MASFPATPLPTSFSPYSHSQTKSKRTKHASNSPANDNEKQRRKQTSPPSTELPSKEQFVQLVGVLAVAALVATATNHIINWYFKPFCDSDAELQALSGKKGKWQVDGLKTPRVFSDQAGKLELITRSTILSLLTNSCKSIPIWSVTIFPGCLIQHDIPKQQNCRYISMMTISTSLLLNN